MKAGRWVPLCSWSYGNTTYLLQGRVRKDGLLRFRQTRLNWGFGGDCPRLPLDVEKQFALLLGGQPGSVRAGVRGD